MLIEDIVAQTRKITCSFTLPYTVDLNGVYDLEKEITNILAWEMYLAQCEDDEMPLQINLEEYDE
jgi:hypothetical protein